MVDKAVPLCVGTCLTLKHLNGFLRDKNDKKQLYIVYDLFWKHFGKD